MSLRSWPNSVCCPVWLSDEHTTDDGLRTVPMESGFLASRRIHDHNPGDYTASYRVSPLEADILEMFRHKVGAGEFELKARLPGQLRSGYVPHRVKFRKNGLKIKPFGAGIFRATVKVRVMEVAIEDFDLYALQAAYGDESTTFVNLFDDLANVEMPDHVGAP